MTNEKMNAARERRALRLALEAVAVPSRAEGEKAYLKSDLDFLGVRMPDLRKIARQYVRQHPEWTIDDWTALALDLWRTRIHELRSVGIAVLAERAAFLRARDMDTIEAMLRRANTWAHVDWICTSVAGPVVERFASANERLSRWVRDDNFWLRRSALLSLLVPLRQGRGDFELFARFADAMLEEKEFFIRKAIGWVLRDVSRRRPELVRDYLASRAHRASGLTFREATRRLPPRVRAELEALRASGATGVS